MKIKILWVNVAILVLSSVIMTSSLTLMEEGTTINILLGSGLLGLVFGLSGFQIIEIEDPKK